MSHLQHTHSSYTLRASSSLGTPPSTGGSSPQLLPTPSPTHASAAAASGAHQATRRRPSHGSFSNASGSPGILSRLSSGPASGGGGQDEFDGGGSSLHLLMDEEELVQEENEFERLLASHIAAVPGSASAAARKRSTSYLSDSPGSGGGGISAPSTPMTSLSRGQSSGAHATSSSSSAATAAVAAVNALPPLSPGFSPAKRQSSVADATMAPLGSKDAAQILPLGHLNLLRAYARFHARTTDADTNAATSASSAALPRSSSISNRNRAGSTATGGGVGGGGKLKQYHTLPASSFASGGHHSLEVPASANSPMGNSSGTAAAPPSHRKASSLSLQRKRSGSTSGGGGGARSASSSFAPKSLTLDHLTPSFLRYAALLGEVSRTRADLKLAGQLGQLLLDQSYKMELQIAGMELRAEAAEDKVGELTQELNQTQAQLDEATVQAAQIASAYRPATPGGSHHAGGRSSPSSSHHSSSALMAAAAASAENESIHEYLRRQIIDTTRAMHEQAQAQARHVAATATTTTSTTTSAHGTPGVLSTSSSSVSLSSIGGDQQQAHPSSALGLVDFSQPFAADQLRQRLKALTPTNLLRAYQQLHNAQQKGWAMKVNGLEKQVMALTDDRSLLSSKLKSVSSSLSTVSALQAQVTALEDERAGFVDRARDQELHHQSAMRHRVQEMQTITKLACEGEIDELTAQVRTLQTALADARMAMVNASTALVPSASPPSSMRKHTRSATGAHEAGSTPGGHQPPPPLPGIAAMHQKLQAQQAEIQALQVRLREYERGSSQSGGSEPTSPTTTLTTLQHQHHRQGTQSSLQSPSPSPPSAYSHPHHHQHHHSHHHHPHHQSIGGATPGTFYIPASPSRSLLLSASPHSSHGGGGGGGMNGGPSEPLRTLSLSLRLVQLPLSLLLPTPLRSPSIAATGTTPMGVPTVGAGSRYLVVSVFIRSPGIAGNTYHFVGMTEKQLVSPAGGLSDVAFEKTIDLKHYMCSSENEFLYSVYSVDAGHRDDGETETGNGGVGVGGAVPVPSDRREKLGSVSVHSYHLLTGVPGSSDAGEEATAAGGVSNATPISAAHHAMLLCSRDDEDQQEEEEEDDESPSSSGSFHRRLHPTRAAIVAKLNLELLHQRERDNGAKSSVRELQRQVLNERREALGGGLTRLIVSCTITPALTMESLPSPPSSRRQFHLPHGTGLTPVGGRSGSQTPISGGGRNHAGGGTQTPLSGRSSSYTPVHGRHVSQPPPRTPTRTGTGERSLREAPGSGGGGRNNTDRNGDRGGGSATGGGRQMVIVSPTPQRFARHQAHPSGGGGGGQQQQQQAQQPPALLVSSPGALMEALDSSRLSVQLADVASPGLTPQHQAHAHLAGSKHSLSSMPWLQSAAVQELLAMDDSHASGADVSGGDFRAQVDRMLQDNGISTSVASAQSGTVVVARSPASPDHHPRLALYDDPSVVGGTGEEGQPWPVDQPGSPEADFQDNSLSFTISPFTPCQPYAAFVKEQARQHPYVHADDLWTKTMAEYASVMGVAPPKTFLPQNLFGRLSMRSSSGGGGGGGSGPVVGSPRSRRQLLLDDGGIEDDEDESSSVIDTPSMLRHRHEAERFHQETLQLQTDDTLLEKRVASSSHEEAPEDDDQLRLQKHTISKALLALQHHSSIASPIAGPFVPSGDRRGSPDPTPSPPPISDKLTPLPSPEQRTVAEAKLGLAPSPFAPSSAASGGALERPGEFERLSEASLLLEEALDLADQPMKIAVHPPSAPASAPIESSPDSSTDEYDRLSAGPLDAALDSTDQPAVKLAVDGPEPSPDTSAGEYERLSDSLTEEEQPEEDVEIFDDQLNAAGTARYAKFAPPPELFDAATQYSPHEAPTRVASPVPHASTEAPLTTGEISLGSGKNDPHRHSLPSRLEPELIPPPESTAASAMPASALISQLSFLLGVPLSSSAFGVGLSPSANEALVGLVALFRSMWIDSLVWFAREMALRQQQMRYQQQKQQHQQHEKSGKKGSSQEDRGPAHGERTSSSFAASSSARSTTAAGAGAPPPVVDLRVCSSVCSVCRASYGLFRREHFCRLCAYSCCADCSAKRVPANVLVARMPGVHAIRGLRRDAEPQRCCERCFLIVEAAEGKYTPKPFDPDELD